MILPRSVSHFIEGTSDVTVAPRKREAPTRYERNFDSGNAQNVKRKKRKGGTKPRFTQGNEICDLHTRR